VVAVGVLVERGVWGPEEAGRFREEAAPATPAERPAPPAETAPAAAGSGAAVEDGLDATAGERARAAAPAPAPEAVFRDQAVPPPAALPPAAEREEAANEARPARDAAAGELLRQRRAEADADAGKAAPEAAEEAAAMDDAAAVPPLERYFAVGRAALAVEDSAAARSALTLWRDTLAAGGAAPAAGPPARLDSADALADSLAAFLGGPPK